MGTLKVYIWKGQSPALSRFARANRDQMVKEAASTEEGVRRYTTTPVLTDVDVIKAALAWWIEKDCPLIDWCAVIGLPKGAWAPTAKDSLLREIPTDDESLLSVVQTLIENRGWLGRGSRISSCVPARATLAIVGDYMIRHRRDHHGEIRYINPLSPFHMTYAPRIQS